MESVGVRRAPGGDAPWGEAQMPLETTLGGEVPASSRTDALCCLPEKVQGMVKQDEEAL